MADEIPVIPPDMRKVYLRLKRWRSSHSRRVPIAESLWTAAGELARAHGINPTAKALHLEYGKLEQRAEAAAPTVKRRKVKALAEGPRRARRTAPPTFVELMAPPSGSFPGAVVELEGPRGRMRIELKGCRHGRTGGAEPGAMGRQGMIQVTPQTRILVAVEAVDFRNGIDGLARVCQEQLQADPFSGRLFVFRNRPRTALKILAYDGRGFWLCQNQYASHYTSFGSMPAN